MYIQANSVGCDAPTTPTIADDKYEGYTELAAFAESFHSIFNVHTVHLTLSIQLYDISLFGFIKRFGWCFRTTASCRVAVENVKRHKAASPNTSKNQIFYFL